MVTALITPQLNLCRSAELSPSLRFCAGERQAPRARSPLLLPPTPRRCSPRALLSAGHFPREKPAPGVGQRPLRRRSGTVRIQRLGSTGVWEHFALRARTSGTRCRVRDSPRAGKFGAPLLPPPRLLPCSRGSAEWVVAQSRLRPLPAGSAPRKLRGGGDAAPGTPPPARAGGKRTPLCWACDGESPPTSAGFLLKINGGGWRNEGVTVENSVTQLQCWPQPHYLPHRWRQQLPHYSLRLSLALRFFVLVESESVRVREREGARQLAAEHLSPIPPLPSPISLQVVLSPSGMTVPLAVCTV